MSLDMLKRLDKEFGLIKHYKSDDLDFIERLPQDATMEETLKFYQSRLHIEYDEVSSLLYIAFAHTDPKTAQAIVTYLIKAVEEELNEFNRRKAKKQLKFIEHEHDIKKKKMQESAAILEEYQNKHLLLDPTAEATASTSIIAKLEASLTQKQIELQTKSNYLNPNNYELQALRSEIRAIKRSLKEAKKGLAGNSEAPLNKILFKYQQLKMQLEFDTEVYKNTLLQLETIRLDALKNAKTLSIVSEPNLPDGYTYPNKPKVFITLVIVMLLLYGIFSMLIAIIKDHKE
jgi:capsular polysaccharide transport system permease protein